MTPTGSEPGHRTSTVRRWLGRHGSWVAAGVGVAVVLVAALVIGPSLTGGPSDASPAAAGRSAAIDVTPAPGASSADAPADPDAAPPGAGDGTATAGNGTAPVGDTPTASTATASTATASTAAESTPAEGAAPAHTPYTPQDQQQADPCDSVPPVAPADLRLLDPTTVVTGGVQCVDVDRIVPGDGRWLIREVRAIPAQALPALLAGLRLPNVEPSDLPANSACTMQLIVVPGFVLDTADGTRIRPGVPGTGCHVKEEALKAFEATNGWPVVGTTPIRQLATEEEIVTGCHGAASAPATWLTVGPHPAAAAALPLPADASLSVCRYAPDPADESNTSGLLTAVGTLTGAAVNQALADLSAPSKACATVADDRTAPRTDWLYVQPVPTPGVDVLPLGAPAVMIEIGGCHRAVDGQRLTTLGVVSPTAVAGWATEPAR